MKFLPSLDAKDRKLLLWCVGIAIALAVATGFLLPNGNDNDNPLPSSYLAGQHGARAAYETLIRSNYPIERWEQPLGDLASTAGPETVVILAQPYSREPDDIKAVRKIVERGGRVLSTGYWGGFILPGEASEEPREFNFAACKLEPEDWTRWPCPARRGWSRTPHGRWATPPRASSTVAQAIPRWLSTIGARDTSSGGRVPRRWKTAHSAALTTLICC